MSHSCLCHCFSNVFARLHKPSLLLGLVLGLFVAYACLGTRASWSILTGSDSSPQALTVYPHNSNSKRKLMIASATTTGPSHNGSAVYTVTFTVPLFSVVWNGLTWAIVAITHIMHYTLAIWAWNWNRLFTHIMHTVGTWILYVYIWDALLTNGVGMEWLLVSLWATAPTYLQLL